MKRSSPCLLLITLLALPTWVHAQTETPTETGGLVNARTYVAAAPWFIEGTVGAALPGPDGTDLGSGQSYGVHLGAMFRPWLDLAISLGMVQARKTNEAIDTDITSGVLRARVWRGSGRLSAYAEGGAGLYRFALKQHSVLFGSEDNEIRGGGLLGTGVLYARSGFWVGLGGQLHAAIGSSDLSAGDMLTFSTIQLTVGAPLGR